MSAPNSVAEPIAIPLPVSDINSVDLHSMIEKKQKRLQVCQDFCFLVTNSTDMQEKAEARLREARLLLPLAMAGEFTQPSLHIFLDVCKCDLHRRNSPRRQSRSRGR